MSRSQLQSAHSIQRKPATAALNSHLSRSVQSLKQGSAQSRSAGARANTLNSSAYGRLKTDGDERRFQVQENTKSSSIIPWYQKMEPKLVITIKTERPAGQRPGEVTVKGLLRSDKLKARPQQGLFDYPTDSLGPYLQKPVEDRAISLNYVSAPTITTLDKLKTDRKAKMLQMNDLTAEESYKNKQQRLKNIADLKQQQEQKMLEQQQRNLKENAEKDLVKQK